MSYGVPPQPQMKPAKTTVSILAAIFLIIIGLFSVLGALAVILGGSMLSSIDGGTGVGGLVTIIGIVTLVLGIAAIVVAVGIFIDKPWAYLGTIIVLAIYLVLQVLALLQGTAGAINIVLAILAGILLYFFLTDASIKRQFGQA